MSQKKNIIIIGSGEVGTNITTKLISQGHNVAVIEKDRQRLDDLANNFDVITVHGNGCLPKSLKAAGAETADALIALSSVDEVNMVACQVAYSLFNIKMRMARIYDQNYLDADYKKLFNDEDLPVDYIISPEHHITERIMEMMDVPRAVDVNCFNANKQISIALKITKEFKYFNNTVFQIRQQVPYNFKTLLISRQSRTIIPTKNDHYEENDIVYFIIGSDDVHNFMAHLGLVDIQAKNILIIGGGNTGYGVAKALENKKYHIKVLEKDLARANYLAENLETSTIIHADAMDFSRLDDANIANMDIVLSLTDSDEVNALTSMYANQQGLENVVSLIKNNHLGELTVNMQFAKIITPRNIVASKVNRFLRSAKIYNISNVNNDKAEIIEFMVNKNCLLNGMTIGEFNSSRKNAKIGSVINKAGISYSNDTIIHSGDRIIVLVLKEYLSEFYEIIEK